MVRSGGHSAIESFVPEVHQQVAGSQWVTECKQLGLLL